MAYIGASLWRVWKALNGAFSCKFGVSAKLWYNKSAKGNLLVVDKRGADHSPDDFQF